MLAVFKWFSRPVITTGAILNAVFASFSILPFAFILIFSVFFIPSGHIQLVFNIPICFCWRINLLIQARQITGFLYLLF